MSVEEFDSGYWYATEIKGFAKKLGIPRYTVLRKDELEKVIKHFLKTGQVKSPTKRSLSKNGDRDSDRQLTMKTPVINYTNNRETKDWIVAQAKKLNKHFKERSGARYRLNRWREEQITAGKAIAYGDLVRHYVELNKPDQEYKKIPSGRYINFLSEYMSQERNPTKSNAIAAWHELKALKIPKTYTAWRKLRRRDKD